MVHKEPVSKIQKAGQIVFHSVGDTGNTRGPRDMDDVAGKMVADFDDIDSRSVPSFFLHLGDVVYSEFVCAFKLREIIENAPRATKVARAFSHINSLQDSPFLEREAARLVPRGRTEHFDRVRMTDSRRHEIGCHG